MNHYHHTIWYPARGNGFPGHDVARVFIRNSTVA